MEWAELIFFLMECLVEFGIHLVPELFCERVAQRSRRKRVKSPPPALTAISGYVVLGVAIGLLSVLLVPKLVIPRGWGRILFAIMIPVICGTFMAHIGRLRQRKGEPLVRMDRFWYGLLLALAIAVTRLIFAE